jgi:hypothetical protein
MIAVVIVAEMSAAYCQRGNEGVEKNLKLLACGIAVHLIQAMPTPW